jgi:peptidoglycan/xylan/chitin deacetylase (PgdA/CDA1 family)
VEHRAATGVFSISFDDGSRSQLELGLPVLAGHGVPGVLFFITGLAGQRFEGERLLELRDLHRLAAAGWEIGSHTVSHPRLARRGETRLTPARLQRELSDSRRWLRSRGFEARSFAYPYGRYNAEIERAAASVYRYVRTTADGLNEPCDRARRLGSYNLCGRKLERFKRAVDEAALTGAWLIGVAHHVAPSADRIPSGDASSWIGAEQLSEAIRHALAAGLEPRTFDEVHAACVAREETTT